jgi:hypothetical protein
LIILGWGDPSPKELVVPLAVLIEIRGMGRESRRQALELEELVVLLVKPPQDGEAIPVVHLAFEGNDAVVQATARPIGGFPPVEVVENGELGLSVHPDEVGQLRGDRSEGGLRAGRVPTECLDPGVVVRPKS